MEGEIFLKKKWILLTAALLLALGGCQGKDETVVQNEEAFREYEVNLSDKLSDFQFAMNEEVYTLPESMEVWKERDGKSPLTGERTSGSGIFYRRGKSEKRRRHSDSSICQSRGGKSDSGRQYDRRCDFGIPGRGHRVPASGETLSGKGNFEPGDRAVRSTYGRV